MRVTRCVCNKSLINYLLLHIRCVVFHLKRQEEEEERKRNFRSMVV